MLNITNKTNTTLSYCMRECPPLEEGLEGGGNELRVHALHLLNAVPDEHSHLLTVVYVWFSVGRLI